MPAVYDKHGVRFMYPENWRVTDEVAGGSHHEVSLQTPGGGFWSLHVYAQPAEPEAVTEEVVKSMRQEYDSLEAQTASETIADEQAVGYDMDFFCLDLLVTARARAFLHDAKTFLILYQAENREFDEVEPVFRAITASLFRPV